VKGSVSHLLRCLTSCDEGCMLCLRNGLCWDKDFMLVKICIVVFQLMDTGKSGRVCFSGYSLSICCLHEDGGSLFPHCWYQPIGLHGIITQRPHCAFP
jgi:hypothetical protein